MIRKHQQGFTLVELMAVVIIIGIFSALAIPGLIEVRYRNSLSDSTSGFRSAGAMVRDSSLQTKQAVVLEVMQDNAWINILQGADCWSDVDLECTTPLGPTISYFDAGGPADNAGVAMCGGAALTRSVPNDLLSDCNIVQTLVASDASGFALCYSGAGELWFRLGSDAGTVCGGGGVPSADVDDWTQTCSTTVAVDVTFADGNHSDLRDGAAVMFNRYGDETACTAPAKGVARYVVFPTSGVPYSTLAEDWP